MATPKRNKKWQDPVLKRAAIEAVRPGGLHPDARYDALVDAECAVIKHSCRLRALAFLMEMSAGGPHEWEIDINVAIGSMIDESANAISEAFYIVHADAKGRMGAANG